MSLISQIKEGILTGDWELVCRAYNFATGEKLTPPEPKIKEFNPSTASKRELYEYIESHRDNLLSISKYKVADLREIAELFFLSNELKKDAPPVEESLNIKPQEVIQTHMEGEWSNSPFFVTQDAGDADKRLAEKLANIESIVSGDGQLKDLLSTGENKRFSKTSRPKYEKVDAFCKRCNIEQKVSPAIVSNIMGRNEFVCESCMKRR